MWYSISLLLVVPFLVTGTNNAGDRFTNHEPDGLQLVGEKCALEYLEERAIKRNCIEYRERMSAYKYVNLNDLIINTTGSVLLNFEQVNESLVEPNVVRSMREGLFKSEKEKDILYLKMVCNMGYFPKTSMKELAELYHRFVWASIQPEALREMILEIVFERLDQLDAVDSVCARLYGKAIKYFDPTYKAVRISKEEIMSAYLEANLTAQFLKQNQKKKAKFQVNESTNTRKHKSSDKNNNKANNNADGAKQETEATTKKTEVKSDDSKGKIEKLSTFKSELIQKTETAMASLSFDGCPQVLIDGFYGLKHLLKTGEITTSLAIAAGKAFCGVTNFIGKIIPLPFVGAIVNVLTGLIGVGLDLATPEVQSEVQVLQQNINMQFNLLSQQMTRQYQEILKEIHETTLIELVFVPGRVVFDSLEAYMVFDDTENILNVCKTDAKNRLFAGISSYLLEANKGYFARTLETFGNLEMFEAVSNMTKMYMLSAIQADIVCMGLKKFTAKDYNPKTDKGIPKKMTPFIKWMMSKYNSLSIAMETFREDVELNAMRKATDFVKYSLSNMHPNNETLEGEELIKNVNKLWSVKHDYYVVFGEMLRFVISGVAYTDKQGEYVFENAILNTESKNQSFAVIRKLKTHVDISEINLEQFSSRWVYFQHLKAELARYTLDTIADLVSRIAPMTNGVAGYVLAAIITFLRTGIAMDMDERYIEKMRHDYVRKGLDLDPRLDLERNTTLKIRQNIVRKNIFGLPKIPTPEELGKHIEDGANDATKDVSDAVEGTIKVVEDTVDGTVKDVSDAAKDTVQMAEEAVNILSAKLREVLKTSDIGSLFGVDSVTDALGNVIAYKDNAVKNLIGQIRDGKISGAFGDLLKQLGLPIVFKELKKHLPKIGFKFEELIETVPSFVHPKFKHWSYDQFEENGNAIMIEDPSIKPNCSILYVWGKKIWGGSTANFTEKTYRSPTNVTFWAIEF